MLSRGKVSWFLSWVPCPGKGRSLSITTFPKKWLQYKRIKCILGKKQQVQRSNPKNYVKKKKQNRDFPGGPVVKNPLLNADVTSLIAGWETKTPCATEQLSLCATTEEPAHQQRARVPPPRPSAARTQTPKQLCAAQSQCEEGLNSGAVLMEVFLINMECGWAESKYNKN